MEQKFLRLTLFILFSSFFVCLNSESLEFLYTNTTAFKGGTDFSTAAAYEMPTGQNNYYIGHIWFPAGFKLGDQINGLNVFPKVGGEIDFNHNTLTLTGDLLLASNGSIAPNFGRVDGNGYSIIFSDDLSITPTIRFIDDTIIDGNNNPMTLGANSKLWVDSGVTLTLQNMIIKDLSDGKIVMGGTDSQLSLDNVTIWLDGDYSFTQGNLFVHNDVNIAGNYAFKYESLQDGYLVDDSRLLFIDKVTIEGNDYFVKGDGNKIIFEDELQVPATLRFKNDMIIDGNDNPLILGASGNLFVDNGVTVTLQNMIIKDLSDGKIIMGDLNSQLVLDNVVIWLDGDYSFTQGSFFVHNDVIISGSSHTFKYQSDENSFIMKQSKLNIDNGVRFSYEPTPGNDDDYLVMIDNTSYLYLKGSTLYAQDSGLVLDTGTVIFDDLVTLSADGQSVASGIEFKPNITAIMVPGSNVQVYGVIDFN